jgi:hypothetical protein
MSFSIHRRRAGGSLNSITEGREQARARPSGSPPGALALGTATLVGFVGV